MPNVPTNVLVLDNLSSGIDRNGQTPGKAGTPTLPSQIVVHSINGPTSINNIPLEELQDSPTLERAEQCTVVHHFRCSYEEALVRLSIYGRGTMVTDSVGNYYRVLSCSVQYQQGGKALLSITSESISFDVPPDEFSCIPTRLSIDLMKYPRYFYALMPTNQIPGYTGIQDTNNQINAKQAIIRAIQAYRENPFIPTTTNLNSMTGMLHDIITANFAAKQVIIHVPNPNYKIGYPASDPPAMGTLWSGLPYPPAVTDASIQNQANPVYYFAYANNEDDPNGRVALAFAAGLELIGKLWRMEDSPLINGLEMTIKEYFFRPPIDFTLGGYIEDPATDGALPNYFYSYAWPPDSNLTMFDQIGNFNPQCYSVTGRWGGGTAISWLRDADTIEYMRTWFCRTKKWLGAPVGAWDYDLYNKLNRPALPGDYRQLLLEQ